VAPTTTSCAIPRSWSAASSIKAASTTSSSSSRRSRGSCASSSTMRSARPTISSASSTSRRPTRSAVRPWSASSSGTRPTWRRCCSGWRRFSSTSGVSAARSSSMTTSSSETPSPLWEGRDGGLKIDRREPVVIITIDRPERRNAVDGKTARELSATFRGFDADPELSVAVLTGASGNFCAGFDLKALAEGTGPEVGEGDGPMGPTYLRLGKPVIAAIEGYCVAGGMELALWCDLRVAATNAVLGIFNRRFGVPLVDGGTVRLARIVGQGRSEEHTSELQSRENLVCRLLLEKKKKRTSSLAEDPGGHFSVSVAIYKILCQALD